MSKEHPVRRARPIRRHAPLTAAEAMNRRRLDFLRRYGFTEEQFQQTGLEWGRLEEVRTRHAEMPQELQTTAAYVVGRLQTVPEVHSLKSRIKHDEHLVEKIIRKKCEG